MKPEDGIDRQWRLYDEGDVFATLAENGDDCPTLTFVADQCGGDGKPLTISESALGVLHAALGEMLQNNVEDERSG